VAFYFLPSNKEKIGWYSGISVLLYQKVTHFEIWLSY